jgi:DNA-binding PadR family transcriptional regulator
MSDRPGSMEATEMFRRRLVGLYSLTLMEQEGAIHGYRISERIAERTQGAWRPGPGAVYPSLRKLLVGGLARSRSQGRRREYSITPAGRAMLARIRGGAGRYGSGRPDMTVLWAEVMGMDNLNDFLMMRLRRAISSIEGYLARAGPSGTSDEVLRRQVADELSAASARLRPERRSRVHPPRKVAA